MDTLRRSGAWYHPLVCEHNRLVAQRRPVVDQLFAWVGSAIVFDRAWRRPISGLFQASACVSLGCIDRQWSAARHCRRHDLCEFVDDDYEFPRAVRYRLVPRSVTPPIRAIKFNPEQLFLFAWGLGVCSSGMPQNLSG